MAEATTESSSNADSITQPFQMRVDHASRVNFALQQNDVPVIREVVMENASDCEYDDLSVSIQVGNGLAEQWVARIAHIGPGEVRRLQKIDLRLDASKLANQLEREKVDITAKIEAAGSQLAEWHGVLDVMAFNEWPGTMLLPEILAAFVTPNHPAIDALLKSSSEFLKQESGDPSFSGYQDGGPARVQAQIGAIYNAMRAVGVRYVSPPASYEKDGQKVRSPDQVLDGRQGACLDLSVVAAAAMEQAGLYPIVLLVEGHAFAGAWLRKEHFNEPSIEDATRILNRVRLREILVYEVTALTDGRTVDFSAACRQAEDHLAKTENFRIAVDVRSARAAGIRPLPPRVANGHGFDVASQGSSDAALGSTPVIDELQRNEHTHSEAVGPRGRLRSNRGSQLSDSDLPKAAQDRLERWKRNLLDLTRRNSLLNFHPSRRIVLLGRDLARLEDGLAAGSGYELRPRFDLFESNAPRDLTLELSRTGRDIPDELLQTELKRGHLCVDLSERDFDKRLVKLYRAARSSIEETGTNTLFLALGGLIWCEPGSGADSSEAPLLLVPVQIDRPAPRRYRLRILDEDTRINETLVEMLRQDFGLPVENLTSVGDDASGIDVDGLFRVFRELIKDIPGWEVRENASLGLFSFAKFMLWTDLEERFDQVVKSPVVRHLLVRPDRPFSSDSFPDASAADHSNEIEKVLCPLDADSSQMIAVQAAVAGNTFVLQGPPGTGKSQTISNLIARSLADGKRVLFVAEKLAALKVVQRRLEKAGLGPFLLELHSAKAGKLEVLSQLRMALDSSPQQLPPGWDADVERMYSSRDHLNSYVKALHDRRPSGESVYDVIGRLASIAGSPRIPLDLKTITTVTTKELESFRHSVTEMIDVAVTVGELANNPLSGVRLTHFHLDAPEQLLAAADMTRKAFADLHKVINSWSHLDGFPIKFLEDPQQVSLSQLTFLLRIWDAITGWQSPTSRILNGEGSVDLSRMVATTLEACREREFLLAGLRSRKNTSLLAKKVDIGKAKTSFQAWGRYLGSRVDDAMINRQSIREFRILSLLPTALANGTNPTQEWLGLPDWKTTREALLRTASTGRRRDELQGQLTQRHQPSFFAANHSVLLQSLSRSVDLWCDVLQLPLSGRPDAFSLRVSDLAYMVRITKMLLDAPASGGILLGTENWEATKEQLVAWSAIGRRAFQTRSKLSVRYRLEFFDLDHAALSHQARATQIAGWATRWLKRRRLHRSVRVFLVSEPIPSEQELISDLQLAAQTRGDEDKLKDASKQALTLLRQQWKEVATDWDVIERVSDWVTKFRKLVTKPPTGSLFNAEELIECSVNLLTDEHQSLTQDTPERTSLLQFIGDVDAAGRQLGRFSIDVPLLADLRIAEELHRHNTEMNSLALRLRDVVDLSRSTGIMNWEAFEHGVAWVDRVRQIAGKDNPSEPVSGAFVDALLKGAGEKQYLVEDETVRVSLKQLARDVADLLAQVALDSADPDSHLLEDIAAAERINALEGQIKAAGDQLADPLGALWKGADSDWNEIQLIVERSQRLRELLTETPAVLIGESAKLAETVAILACTAPGHQGRGILGDVVRCFAATKKALEILAKSAGCESWEFETDPTAPLSPQWEKRIDRWKGGMGSLRQWCQWQNIRQANENKPLLPLFDALERGAISHTQLSAAFEMSYGRAWISEVISADGVLSNFSPERHDKKLAEFRNEDRNVIEISRRVLSGRLHAMMDNRGIVLAGGIELVTLKRELSKQKRHLPVRKLVQQLPSLLPRLKPCWLMSPLSVAQYLDPRMPPFDLVVFDEASQIPTWDAVGALARGTQAIVVGDSKQLPPTNFFQRENNDDSPDESDSEELESILDECVASGIPELSLKWHYRSRHESLIAFSNRHYYADRLFTFPSADSKRKDRGVSFRHVMGGVYDRGRKRTNEAEARAIAAEVVRRVKSGDKRSIGIVTFSQPQQELVENLLDEERQRLPQLDELFASSRDEPIFVKNLENVQGDERDVILFSVCYGPDKDGEIWMSFGALNNPGGERRLNVAITRAREQVVVFASIKPDQINLGRSRAIGVAHLRAFLEYAERGAKVLSEIVTPAEAAGSPPIHTPFEDSIRKAIHERGWKVESRVGCSGYRIDLAVKDPNSPDRYLMGIECDGLNYQQADTARDRDRLRSEILSGLGWSLHRVWSIDWLHDPAKCITRIEKLLSDARSTQS